MRLRVRVLLVALLVQFVTTSAFAGVRPGLLLVDGNRLLDPGRPADPCAQLDERHRREPTLGIRLELAECHEHHGRTASAWSGYLEVAAAARSRGEQTAEKTATDRAAALEPRLVRLTIDVDAVGTKGLVLERNGAAVPHAEWGFGVPIDPGSYTFLASAPGRNPWTSMLVVNSERSTWSVHVPELEVAQPMKEGLQITRPTPAPMREGSALGGIDGLRTASLLTLGVGAIAVGAGAYFGLRSIDQRNDARALCNSQACEPQKSILLSRAADSQTMAAGTIAIGAGLMLIGALLWWFSPSRKALLHPAPPKPGVRVAPGLGRIDIRGTF